jgi:asparagine N-glycosylation enzyme membrane subunit Stt3
LDSYTNVSSESDWSSSTAFATFASKMSALEDVVPDMIEGGFFIVLFFLGLIVSTLDIFRKVPLSPLPVVLSAALAMIVVGIDATVSVSTVIFFADVSLLPRIFVGTRTLYAFFTVEELSRLVSDFLMEEVRSAKSDLCTCSPPS